MDGPMMLEVITLIHEGSHMFVGETREVIVPEGMSPRKFRKEFHKVQFNPDSLQSDILVLLLLLLMR